MRVFTNLPVSLYLPEKKILVTPLFFRCNYYTIFVLQFQSGRVIGNFRNFYEETIYFFSGLKCNDGKLVWNLLFSIFLISPFYRTIFLLWIKVGRVGNCFVRIVMRRRHAALLLAHPALGSYLRPCQNRWRNIVL